MGEAVENRRESEGRGSGEEEAMGAEEGGGGGRREREGGGGGEAEPEVGEGVEGEGLVVLRGGVVDAIEEEPRASLDLVGGEGGGGDDGAPLLADC